MGTQKETINVTQNGDNFKITRVIEEELTAEELIKVTDEIQKGLENQVKTSEESGKAIKVLRERFGSFGKHLLRAELIAIDGMISSEKDEGTLEALKSDRETHLKKLAKQKEDELRNNRKPQ